MHAEGGTISRVKCPQCSNIVERPAVGNPVCDACGYGSNKTQRAAPTTTATPRTATPTTTRAPGNTPQASPQRVGHGKVRNPFIVVLLSIVTFGIYGIVWQYLVFKEVDTQSNQVHKSGLFIAGIILIFIPFINFVGAILLLVYLLGEINQLRNAKQQAGLPPGMGAGAFIGIVILAWIVGMVAFFAIFAGAGGLASATENPDAAGGAMIGSMLLGFAVLLVVSYLPYIILQTQVNNYWQGLGSGRQPARTMTATA